MFPNSTKTEDLAANHIRTSNENGKVQVKLGQARDKYLRNGKFKIPNNFHKKKRMYGQCVGKKTNEKLCVGSCRRAANKEQIREALIDRRPDGGTTKKETFYSRTTKRKLLSTKTVFAQKYFIIQCFLTFAKFPHS